jgi:hypothetical protein
MRGKIRTSNLLILSQPPLPIGLRALRKFQIQNFKFNNYEFQNLKNTCGEIRTHNIWCLKPTPLSGWAAQAEME